MKKLLTMVVAGFMACHVYAQKAAPDTAVVNFVTEAAKGGMMEVNSGKLAMKKAKSPSVKAFGAKMVTDHTKANAELKGIVALKRWNITPPPATTVQPDAMLTSTAGAEFDKSYVNMMVMDHKKTIALFQHAAASNPDPQIKAFATRTLPKLRQHLTLIEQIGDKLGIAYEK